jgi:serine/threonine protein kinase
MDYRQVLQTGTVLDGKYRIERVIGSGGFGITYEAFDIGLAAPVAIRNITRPNSAFAMPRTAFVPARSGIGKFSIVCCRAFCGKRARSTNSSIRQSSAF